VGSGTSLEYSARSDVGLRRANNQDAHAVLEPWNAEQYRRRGWLFLVADGMGAHAAGEMASAMAAEQVPLVYEKLAGKSPALALRLAVQQANDEIHAKGESSLDLKGMGTTCTTLALVPRGAVVGHVGDSRAYRVRGGRIEQLSRDHSLAWDLEDMQAAGGGQGLDPREAPKNIITRSLGPHPQVQVDLEGPFPVEAGDVFVLCSDGLSGQVADGEIGLVAASLPPREAAAALVGLALVRGAPDNVTVIVARAGAKEVSKTGPADPPWPLTADPADSGPRPLPWRWLAAAAVSLFAALVGLGFWKEAQDDLSQGITLAVAGLALLSFLATLLFSFLGFLLPAHADQRMLPVGGRLGKGPYRSHDCGPTAELVGGIVASVAAAAAGLDGPPRARTDEQVRRARARLEAGDPRGALAATAAAIAAYAEAVGAARGEASGPGGRKHG
jgi:protein phosphatase